MKTKTELKVGDVVSLNSGGPKWVIESISKNTDDSETADLVRHDDDRGMIYRFEIDVRCVKSLESKKI